MKYLLALMLLVGASAHANNFVQNEADMMNQQLQNLAEAKKAGKLDRDLCRFFITSLAKTKVSGREVAKAVSRRADLAAINEVRIPNIQSFCGGSSYVKEALSEWAQAKSLALKVIEGQPAYYCDHSAHDLAQKQRQLILTAQELGEDSTPLRNLKGLSCQ